MGRAQELPEEGGAYLLLLQRTGRPAEVEVGALGAVTVRPGFYGYVGSARSGLRARLERHLRTAGKRTHWHVDYLRSRTDPVAVLVWTGEGADECALAALAAGAADGSVPGFGCSDCGCPSHLFYFAREPAAALRALSPAGAWWIEMG